MYSSTSPAILQQMSPFVPISLGKYGYKYLEEGEEEGDFTSRVGQRNMIKDIIKQEIVIGEGEKHSETEPSFLISLSWQDFFQLDATLILSCTSFHTTFQVTVNLTSLPLMHLLSLSLRLLATS